ncbi:MAG: hypothetical protein AMJ79_08120 [Phycisphaerae bacterium SM23_30]|nr:MAG: hypothetical protein AMJ79_08120 [Phycisphaerae bacterium SM23_30]
MNHKSNMDEGMHMPLHRRIAENLGSQVSSGKLKPGERLPSERQIAREYQASRATVRTALQHLEQAGLITRRERRSAVVTIRRDIAPYLRIACSNPRLVHIFSRLSDLQLLPPRCQLQLNDLQQSDALGRLMSQPATAADLMIFDFEHTRIFRTAPEQCQTLTRQFWSDCHINPQLHEMFAEENDYFAEPVCLTCQLVYVNHALLQEAQVEMPAARWQWDQFVETARRLTHGGRYGFQFRPSFSHLAELMARRGGQLYQADGTIASNSSEAFEPTVRFIHELVHLHKVSPILAKADQLNLFAENRCAMALDGFDMFHFYREKMGDNLGVTVLPSTDSGGGVIGGFAALAPARQEECEPVFDLLRTLLSPNTQRTLAQIGGGLPARTDLLNIETLESLKVPRATGQIFLEQLQNSRPANQPAHPDHKRQVENLFLEEWLGLDNIESICRRFKELGS